MSSHDVALLLLGVAVIIGLARLLGVVAKRLGQPPVIGEIIAGVLVGPSLFGTAITGRLFPSAVLPALSGLANVGLVLFMFIIGYELDHSSVRGKERVAASVSVGSIILPFGLGAALAVRLAPHHGVTRVLPFALFMGAAMAVTAFPVLARILTDRGMHRIELGGLALASAAVDDVVAWSLLAVVVLIGKGATDQWHLFFAIPYLVVMFTVVRPLLRRLVAARDRAGRLTPNILAVILAGLLLSCYATEWLGVHVIFGAFLFGAVMPRAGGEALRHEILERLEQVSILLLLPVFFVISGMKVNLSTLNLRGVVELGMILAVAVVGKFVGAYLGARLQGIPIRKAGALATLMNTRGLTEIVILTVGLQLHILDDQLFSMMVVMALVTTMMAGPLLGLIYPKARVERDVAEAEKAALGVTDAYRVQVVTSAADESDAALLALGAVLAGQRRPAEVVLSRLLPYGAGGLELGAGLSGELLEMTRAMQELELLATPVRRSDLEVRVLARFGADPVRDLAAQVAATSPDVLVVAQGHPGYSGARQWSTGRLLTLVAAPPAQYQAVLVRAGDVTGADLDATVQVGAQLAVARGVELVLSGGRAGRRLAATVKELNRAGVRARFADNPEQAGHSALVIAPDGADGAGVHLLVRADEVGAGDDVAVWAPGLVAGGAVPN